MIVDTEALAVALGVSASHVRKLVHLGRIAPAYRKRRAGTNGRGRPMMWFDLDVVVSQLDRRSSGCDSS